MHARTSKINRLTVHFLGRLHSFCNHRRRHSVLPPKYNDLLSSDCLSGRPNCNLFQALPTNNPYLGAILFVNFCTDLFPGHNAEFGRFPASQDPIVVLCKGPPAANLWNVGERMGFSVPSEGKIDDIDLTSKQRGWGIQNFVIFLNSVVYADCH